MFQPIIKQHTIKSLAKDSKISSSSLPGIGPMEQDRSRHAPRSPVHVLTDGAMPFHETAGTFYLRQI